MPATTPRITRRNRPFMAPLPAPASVFLSAGAARLLDALALVVVEHPLAQANRLRRHLDQLVIVDELQRRLQREHARGREEQLLVSGRGADVGQLLGLGR